MPLKLILGEPTGIYRQCIQRADDPKAMNRLMRAMAKASDLNWILDRCEREARRILRKYGLEKKKWWIKLPETAPAVARDAREVRFQVKSIRDWCSKGHPANVALHGFTLGRAYERMLVRPFEPHAKRGRKVLEASRRGHEVRYGTGEEKREEWNQYQQKVNELARRHPQWSHTYICRRVAGRFGVSPKTIQRHTRLPARG